MVGAGEIMNRNHILVCYIILVLLFMSGCGTIPRYRQVNDGVDRKQYQVVGRVLNSFQKPVVDCQIYMTKNWSSNKKDIPGQKQHVPVAVTDYNGDYSFLFELDDATKFYLYFDARLQGYQARYLDITHLFTSELWQYSGTNPVVANAILIPDKIMIENDFVQ